MINLKRLTQLARKWRMIAAMGRRRISFKRASSPQHPNRGKTTVADKGHFVVCTAGNRRLMVPLACLNNSVFLELLHISEEEFGLSTYGPITLPCDTVFLKSVIAMVKSHGPNDIEKDLLCSLASSRCSSSTSFQPGHGEQHLLLNVF